MYFWQAINQGGEGGEELVAMKQISSAGCLFGHIPLGQ